MAITVILKIGTTDLTSYISDYEVSYEQMFADANRNMQGSLRANYVGTVPKISVTFRHLTQSEMTTIINLLNDDTFSVTWWDEDAQATKTANFYRGELKTGLYRATDSVLYKTLSVNLIAYDPISGL
jgi:hypothetical protein